MVDVIRQSLKKKYKVAGVFSWLMSSFLSTKCDWQNRTQQTIFKSNFLNQFLTKPYCVTTHWKGQKLLYLMWKDSSKSVDWIKSYALRKIQKFIDNIILPKPDPSKAKNTKGLGYFRCWHYYSQVWIPTRQKYKEGGVFLWLTSPFLASNPSQAKYELVTAKYDLKGNFQIQFSSLIINQTLSCDQSLESSKVFLSKEKKILKAVYCGRRQSMMHKWLVEYSSTSNFQMVNSPPIFGRSLLCNHSLESLWDVLSNTWKIFSLRGLCNMFWLAESHC